MTRLELGETEQRRRDVPRDRAHRACRERVTGAIRRKRDGLSVGRRRGCSADEGQRCLVHPRLDGIDERAAVLETVLTELRACPGGGLMSDTWRESGTLRVHRREPYTTSAFKLLPLHILGTTSEG